jgi:hypothetical protein
MAIRSGRYGIDINNPEFRQFRDGTGVRVFRERIPISPTLPGNVGIAVQVALAHFDVEKVANTRITVHAENLSRSGFDLVFTTWADTRIWGLTATWIAHTIE